MPTTALAEWKQFTWPIAKYRHLLNGWETSMRSKHFEFFLVTFCFPFCKLCMPRPCKAKSFRTWLKRRAEDLKTAWLADWLTHDDDDDEEAVLQVSAELLPWCCSSSAPPPAAVPPQSFAILTFLLCTLSSSSSCSQSVHFSSLQSDFTLLTMMMISMMARWWCGRFRIKNAHSLRGAPIEGKGWFYFEQRER